MKARSWTVRAWAWLAGVARSLNEGLCGLGADKYAHFIAGLVTAEAVAALAVSRMGLAAALAGWGASCAAGALKEAVDLPMGGECSFRDWVATVAGGAAGALLSVAAWAMY